jgi:CHAT domain/Tetratricopeptide repeat
MAWVHDARGRHGIAEELFRSVVSITATALGTAHPDYASALHRLASLLTRTGDHDEAQRLLLECMTTTRDVRGDDHPDLARALQSLAATCAATGHTKEAFGYVMESVRITDGILNQVVAITSEQQRLAYLHSTRHELELLMTLCTAPNCGSDVVREAFTVVLRRKGLATEVLGMRSIEIMTGHHPDLEPTLRELGALQSQIAKRTLDGPGPEGRDHHSRLLAQWNERREDLERDVARRVPEFGLATRMRRATIHSVSVALPAETVLVDIVQAATYAIDPTRLGQPLVTRVPRYFAFVLAPDHDADTDAVPLVDLGSADDIDGLVGALRADIESGAYLARDAGTVVEASRANDHALTALAAAVLHPLLAHLRPWPRLIIAPDGNLAKLPFEILPVGSGQCVVDAYELSYLGAGRDSLMFARDFATPTGPPVVMAAPNYDLAASDTDAGMSLTPVASSDNERMSTELREGRHVFVPLEGVAAEGRSIAAFVGVNPKMGDDALEGTLKRVCSPMLLHLATHGFFLPDRLNRDHGVRSNRLLTGNTLGPLGGDAESALLRSGLALAGANTRLRGGRLPVDAEDGILNAEDVTALDLRGTELVVLSACDTGLGDIQVGEGVFGLRRSFVLAGAHTVVMSLWKVPDDGTRRLMELFYGFLVSGKGRAEALREAALSIKRERPTDVRAWGAFICVGDRGVIHSDWPATSLDLPSTPTSAQLAHHPRSEPRSLPGGRNASDRLPRT